MSWLNDASSAIIIDRGKKNNNDTKSHDGIAAGPKATAFVVMLPNPNVGTKVSITRVQRPSFFELLI